MNRLQGTGSVGKDAIIKAMQAIQTFWAEYHDREWSSGHWGDNTIMCDLQQTAEKSFTIDITAPGMGGVDLQFDSDVSSSSTADP